MRIVNGIGWFLILGIRGLALWVLIPCAFLAWLSVHLWWQKASLPQALSWYDRNFVTVLVNGPFRLWVRPAPRPRLIGMAEMTSVDPHDLGLLHLY